MCVCLCACVCACMYNTLEYYYTLRELGITFYITFFFSISGPRRQTKTLWTLYTPFSYTTTRRATLKIDLYTPFLILFFFRASEADKDPLDPLYTILVHYRTPRDLAITIRGLFNRLDVDCSGCISFDEVCLCGWVGVWVCACVRWYLQIFAYVHTMYTCRECEGCGGCLRRVCVYTHTCI